MDTWHKITTGRRLILVVAQTLFENNILSTEKEKFDHKKNFSSAFFGMKYDPSY